MQIDKDNWNHVIDAFYIKESEEYFIEIVDDRYPDNKQRAIILLTKEEALAFADAIIKEIHNDQ